MRRSIAARIPFICFFYAYKIISVLFAFESYESCQCCTTKSDHQNVWKSVHDNTGCWYVVVSVGYVNSVLFWPVSYSLL